MCGIAGSVNHNFSESLVSKAMFHRGPDEQIGFISGNVQFFHLRLSISDILMGRQPMSLNNRYTIIFNGEIFNHLELRSRFGLSGNTSSDTETLLLLYEKLGTDLLDTLDGMFAFAIFDKIQNKLFIARDRAGEKPLYYFRNEEKFLFASELNGLKTMMATELDLENFYSYLRFGSFYRNLTPFKNVQELEPGHFIVFDCTDMKFRKSRWWNVHTHFHSFGIRELNKNLERTDELLHDSVKSRLANSDLEIGSFLSGGIDSGLITAIASFYKPNIKTFTVSFDGEFDEAPLARMVSKKYQTTHHEIRISFDNLESDVEKILLNYGEPFFDSSAIPSYYVSKAAKEYVTVVLNGDGADELFAGYRRYVPFSKFDFFTTGSSISAVACALKKIIPSPKKNRSHYGFLHRLVSLASKEGIGKYLSAGVDIFEDFEQHLKLDEDEYFGRMQYDFSTITDSKLSGLKKLMNLDFDMNLCNDLLVKMDIATMANSQEGRSPFLSKELLEFAPSIPDKFLINGGTTKFLLRKLAERYLPSPLISQPKRGFEIPLKDWVGGTLKSVIHDYIGSQNSLHKSLINQDFVNQLMNNKIRVVPEKRAKIIWTIFAMEVWYQNLRR